MSLFVQITLFLAVALLLVPLAKRFTLGTLLGCLLSGIVLGPQVLHLNQDHIFIEQLSNIGMLLLLFLIGLELRPQRISKIRGQIAKLAGSQLLFSTVLLISALLLLFKLPLPISFLLAVALALSSTSLVLQQLDQHQLLNSRLGQHSFSLLLVQDCIAIVLLTLIPILLPNNDNIHHDVAYFAGLIAALSGLFLLGRYVIRPLLRFVLRSGATELLTAVGLLQSIIVFVILDLLAVPSTVSALVAGILLADSEFHHEFEQSLRPFRGLLIGLFFVTVGMSLNLNLMFTHPILVVTTVLGLMLIKALAMLATARFYQGNWRDAILLTLSLAQAGELAFIVLKVTFNAGAITKTVFDPLNLVVAWSMLMTPVLFWLMNRYVVPYFEYKQQTPSDHLEHSAALIIAGFGRSGQIIARVAHLQQLPFTVIDNNIPPLNFLQDYAGRLVDGDATEEQTLITAGIASARVFVLAIDDVESSLQIARYIRLNYPQLCLIARARDRHHMHLLKELGISHIWRETYLSSLGMAYRTLCTMGITAQQAQQQIEVFRDHDETLLAEQQRIYSDDEKVYESYRNFVEELNYIFASDRQSVMVQPTDKDSPINDNSNTITPNSTVQDRINPTRNEFD